MTNFAIVDANGKIINRITMDVGANWKADANVTAVPEAATPLEIGGTYINGVYTPPVAPQPQVFVPPTLTPVQKLASIGLTVADLKGLIAS